MPTPLDGACLASLPHDSLAALAEVRAAAGVEVALLGGRAWVRWPAGNEAVLRCVLPLPGAVLYEARDGLWYRPGARLPSFDVPAITSAQPLAQALTPAPVRPRPPDAAPLRPLSLRLVRDATPRPATALCCTAAELARWADTATSAALAAVRAAVSANVVLLVGDRLPPLADAERFWGQRVLVPLGFRPQPYWPESALSDALGLADGELALLGESGATAVLEEALRPLTRAGARLAARGATP
jgi:hypothetical protein